MIDEKELAASLMEEMRAKYDLVSFALIPAFVDNLERELNEYKRKYDYDRGGATGQCATGTHR